MANFSRRRVCRRCRRIGPALGLLIFLQTPGIAAPSKSPGRQISKSDRAFLEELSYRSFLFFWEQADPHTGLIPDRALVVGLPAEGHVRNIANLAATGFGLTAICIGAKHQWITGQQAKRRILLTLNFLATQAPEVHGFYYHWMDKTNGQRIMHSEISSIDTALLLAGVLTTREAFPHDVDIVRLATFIYQRVDFKWMLNGSPVLLSHGWVPGSGFLTHRWDSYCELMILYLEGIGSPTHPIPAASWYAWRRPLVHFEGYTFVGDLPLFTQQYSQAWIDMRGLRDAPPSDIDYFQNSIAATLANRAFCLRFQKAFPKSYSDSIWGVTASDSPRGYMVWGEPSDFASIDGTVTPCAPGGSLVFAPKICVRALEAMREKFGSKVYSRYGFADAFNPTEGWYDRDVIGIDVGVTLLSAENLLDGGVWKMFMRNNNIQRAMVAAKLRPEGALSGVFSRYYQFYEQHAPF